MTMHDKGVAAYLRANRMLFFTSRYYFFTKYSARLKRRRLNLGFHGNGAEPLICEHFADFSNEVKQVFFTSSLQPLKDKVPYV